MGINARYSDGPTDLVERATSDRDERDRSLREQVRLGHLSVLDYLTQHKGYSREHAEALEVRFREAILTGGDDE